MAESIIKMASISNLFKYNTQTISVNGLTSLDKTENSYDTTAPTGYTLFDVTAWANNGCVAQANFSGTVYVNNPTSVTRNTSITVRLTFIKNG